MRFNPKASIDRSQIETRSGGGGGGGTRLPIPGGGGGKVGLGTHVLDASVLGEVREHETDEVAVSAPEAVR